MIPYKNEIIYKALEMNEFSIEMLEEMYGKDFIQPNIIFENFPVIALGRQKGHTETIVSFAADEKYNNILIITYNHKMKDDIKDRLLNKDDADIITIMSLDKASGKKYDYIILDSWQTIKPESEKDEIKLYKFLCEQKSAKFIGIGN